MLSGCKFNVGNRSTQSPMRAHLILASLALVPALARLPHHPAPREYSTHTYYVLELSESSDLSPSDAASLLGADLVERVGELDGHWLVRAETAELFRKSILGESGVEERWLEKRLTDSRLGEIKHVERMVPRQRHKRAWSERADVFGSSSKKAESDMSEWDFLVCLPSLRFHALGQNLDVFLLLLILMSFLFIQENVLDIHDPLLSRQWHIVNTQMPENELNLTKIWNRGITGQGVHVALIDDGLDMTSEDLKDNFVIPIFPTLVPTA